MNKQTNQNRTNGDPNLTKLTKENKKFHVLLSFMQSYKPRFEAL